MKKTLQLDFAGVMCDRNPSEGLGVSLDGGPLPGFFEFVVRVADMFNIVFYDANYTALFHRRAVENWYHVQFDKWEAEKHTGLQRPVFRALRTQPAAHVHLTADFIALSGGFPTADSLKGYDPALPIGLVPSPMRLYKRLGKDGSPYLPALSLEPVCPYCRRRLAEYTNDGGGSLFTWHCKFCLGV